MRVSICVPEPDDRGDLRAAAKRAWNDFQQAVKNPLGEVRVSYGTTLYEIGGARAVCRPMYGTPGSLTPEDTVQLILGRTAQPDSQSERHLTLLHECIHMQFAFGDHRARWMRIQSDYRADEKAIEALRFSEPLARLNYLERRNDSAYMLLQTAGRNRRGTTTET